jgi:hypothetical protein
MDVVDCCGGGCCGEVIATRGMMADEWADDIMASDFQHDA